MTDAVTHEPNEPVPMSELPVPSARAPFARLVLSVGSALVLALFVIATSTTVVAAASFVVRDQWPDWLQGLTYFGLITAAYAVQLVAVWVLARDRGLSFGPAVGLNRFPIGRGIAVAVGVSVGARVLATLGVAALQVLGVELPQAADPIAFLGSGPVSVVFVLLLLMVVAPFAEEVVFRGVIMASLHQRFGPRWAIVGSGLLFAAIHIQPATAFAIVFVGLALGWIAMRYRSIWPSVIAHSLFNGVSAGAIYWLRTTDLL